MRLLPLLVLLASAACAADNHGPVSDVTTASGATIHTAINPAATFDRYRTFSFGPAEGPPAGYQMSPRSAEVRRRLQPLITAALVQKGYAAVPDKGDLLVMFGSGLRDTSAPSVSSVSAGWLPDDENADFVEGSLVIDAFDGPSANRVWHGASRASINPDKIDDQRLQSSVQELLAAFPAASAPVPAHP
jgi:hypothetical protein